MSRAEKLREYRQLVEDRAIAEREYARLCERRQELLTRKVRNEERRTRFLLRLDRDIVDAHDRLASLNLALEGFEL